MKRIILPVLLGLLLSMPDAAKAQQFPLVSQYMFNTLYVNPAYAGYKGDLYAHAFFRTQWLGMNGAPQTFTVGADMGISDEQLGLGLTFTNDRYGANHTNAFMTDYAYWVKLNNTSLRLSFGLTAGVINYGVDGSKLDPTKINDPSVATTMYNVWMPEAGAGVYLSDNRFYVGFSAMNLLSRYLPIKDEEKDRYIVRNYTQLMLMGGVLFPLGYNFDIKPAILIREDFNSPTSMDLNVMFFIAKTVWIGASYRTNATFGKDYPEVSSFQSSALALLLEAYIGQNLRIGYSFDFDFGAISSYSGGNHEISLGYRLAAISSSNKRKIQKMRYF